VPTLTLPNEAPVISDADPGSVKVSTTVGQAGERPARTNQNAVQI